MFGPDIQRSVVDELIPGVLEEILEAKAIRPAGAPIVEDVSYEEGHDLRFKAVIEVWPEFELPAYTKIKARKIEASLTEDDVVRAVDELREKAVEYVPVEGRGVAANDYAVVELQGKDVKTRRLMPVEKVVVLAGHEGNDPAINAHLLGLVPGEEKTFRHAYPADHKNKKLAGKEIEYRLKVLSIKEKKLPRRTTISPRRSESSTPWPRSGTRSGARSGRAGPGRPPRNRGRSRAGRSSTGPSSSFPGASSTRRRRPCWKSMLQSAPAAVTPGGRRSGDRPGPRPNRTSSAT